MVWISDLEALFLTGENMFFDHTNVLAIRRFSYPQYTLFLYAILIENILHFPTQSFFHWANNVSVISGW